MRAFLVVVDHGFRDEMIEMLHPNGDEVIEAFLLRGLNEPLDEGLGVGRLRRRLADGETRVLQRFVEGRRVLAVPVAHYDFGGQTGLLDVRDEGLGLLLGPLAVGVEAGWRDEGASGADVEEDQHEGVAKALVGQDFLGEEVALPEGGRVQLQELVPSADATQAVGKLPVDVGALGVDLMSFTAHKIYGPKGVGALYVRRGEGGVRLVPQIDGGGQEHGLRSGTLNTPGIVGFARALELCLEELPAEAARLTGLRRRLFNGLQQAIDGVTLNGPALDQVATDGTSLRLSGNLNVSFARVDGEALMMNMGSVAVSSGSACTSANPEPSHVLRALGLDDDATRASLRYGIGRFNTPDEIDYTVSATAETVTRLRKLGS